MWCFRLSFVAAGHLIAFNPVLRLRYLEAGWLLATPTSFWQHHIETQSAFPQQLLQVTKIFSLRPPTFLSIKTNELTLNRGRPFDPESCVLRFDSRSVRQLNTNELTLEEAPNGRDGVYQLGLWAYQQRHQREPFHYDACPDITCSLHFRPVPLKTTNLQALKSLLARPRPC